MSEQMTHLERYPLLRRAVGALLLAATLGMASMMAGGFTGLVSLAQEHFTSGAASLFWIGFLLGCMVTAGAGVFLLVGGSPPLHILFVIVGAVAGLVLWDIFGVDKAWPLRVPTAVIHGAMLTILLVLLAPISRNR